MLKKFTEPYRHAPARISTDRIDAGLAQGAQAEIQSPGQRNRAAVSMVTLKTLDGRIIDQWPIHGHVSDAHKFVASYNRVLAQQAPPAPPQPPPGYPPPPPGYQQQPQYPPQPPPGYYPQPPQQRW